MNTDIFNDHRTPLQCRVNYVKPKLTELSSASMTLASKMFSMNEGMTMMAIDPAFGPS